MRSITGTGWWRPRRSERRRALTLCITTRDAEQRLGLLLAEARCYADEVVVGVDLASRDRTWDVAVAGADRVFGFRQQHGAGPARLAGFERARGEWVLFLDDDEGMDAAFPDLLDELLGATGVTHWWLSRKWVTCLDPPEYLRAVPWFPDETMRLVRNDAGRIFKPGPIHSGLLAIGAAGREHRTSILHYERLDRSEESRAAKLRRYREHGQGPEHEPFYTCPPGTPRMPVEPPPLRGRAGRARVARLRAVEEPDVDDLDMRPRLPGWGAIVDVDMPGRARTGERLVVTASARNTGTLRWVPPSAVHWPLLALGCRFRDTGSALVDRGTRAPVGRDVAPGDVAHFQLVLDAPDVPGDYVVEWQMLSEHEFWFSDLGSPPATRPLAVRPS